MSASQQQSGLNSNSYTLGPDSNKNLNPTSENTVGSTTAYGAGPHPVNNAGDSNAVKSSTKYGPQAEDLDGEQMATLPEGKVYEAQLNKREKGGWGEEPSMTADLERKKAEQEVKREAIKEARKRGEIPAGDVDGGSPRMIVNEANSAV